MQEDLKPIMAFDLIRWLREAALPLWEEGFDTASGMFFERMSLDGRPITDTPRRVMVQARQIIAFVEARAIGWYANENKIETAAESLLRNFRTDSEGGWIFSIGSDHRPHDTTRDLYAHAFALSALASMKRLTGDDSWLDLADKTLGFIENNMATPTTGGFLEAVPRAAAPRRQNPHMHLFEACLALSEVAPSRGYEQRADAMFTLLTTRFLHGPRPIVIESYDDDLRPIGGPPFAYEPGHHFEWAWLLSKYAEREPKAAALASRLRDIAACDCVSNGDLIFEELSGTGEPLNRSTRLWAYAEALRASTLAFAGVADAERSGLNPANIADAMQRRFLAPAKAGCWIDHVDSQDRPASTFVAASGLYHLVSAACALHARGRG